MPTVAWRPLSSQMPWGCFLSEGAYKRVYRVMNTEGQREGGAEWQQEAVSVMNVQSIKDSGSEAVVEQELHVSLLVSALVRKNVCPNFVETYGVFR